MRFRFAPSTLERRVRNALHTLLLLAAMANLAGFLGYALSGTSVVVWAAPIGTVFVAFAYEVSPEPLLV